MIEKLVALLERKKDEKICHAQGCESDRLRSLNMEVANAYGECAALVRQAVNYDEARRIIDKKVATLPNSYARNAYMNAVFFWETPDLF